LVVLLLAAAVDTVAELAGAGVLLATPISLRLLAKARARS
jgi:hypothetical protein